MPTARPASRSAPRLDWIVAPPWLPAWLGLIGFGWWERAAREPAAAGGALASAVALAARALGWLLEAGFYAMCWRAAGARVPLGRLAVALATFSLLDLMALTVRDSRLLAGSTAAVALAGRAPRAGEGALAAALATTGLLAVARMVCTAHAQARALGRGMAAPLALTAAAWLASRVVLALVADLARGGSPLP